MFRSSHFRSYRVNVRVDGISSHNKLCKLSCWLKVTVSSIMQKYFRSRADGPSSRQTGDDGVGDTLVCPGIFCRQKAITSPVWENFLNLCDKTPVFVIETAYQESNVIQRMTPRTNVSQQESYQSIISRTISTIVLTTIAFSADTIVPSESSH